MLRKKIKTSIALDEELLKWIDSQIRTKRFANRTHAIEYALEQLRKNEK
jgi:Arc/MetJ-type ribon-helix-helix transcriptional regulator